MRTTFIGAAAIATLLTFSSALHAQVPREIDEPNTTIVAIYHAEGAQIYECAASADGKLVWTFREPVATLVSHQNLTVGRHYAGPHWELMDGSSIGGKPVGRSPGKTADDIPWLKLTAVNQRGDGKLDRVDVIQRINTKGGVASGSCDDRGRLLSVPYAADYTFLHKD